MKKLLLIIFAFCSIYGFGQIENFRIENEQIIWQKIFETDKSFEQICTLIESNAQFSEIEKKENLITFVIKDYKIDFRGAGKGSFFTSPYITNAKYSGDIKLEYKDAKYRITLNNITYLLTAMDLNFGLNQTKYTLGEGAIKRNEFRNAFKKDANIFNYSFNKTFNIDNYNDTSTDW